MKNATTRRGLLIFGAVIILALVFGAGFVAGRMSVRFTTRADAPRVIPGGHGALGAIQSIEGPVITLATRDGIVQVVVDQKTLIERATRGKTITLAELRVGDRIAVIGSPNDQGQIVAKLISQLGTTTTRTPATPTRGASDSK
ncbi:MAG: hypothetical protein HY868_04200 [Chloroflexi bacterium]|nr:hypothetical protein [Chloroflexota bacterium]